MAEATALLRAVSLGSRPLLRRALLCLGLSLAVAGVPNLAWLQLKPQTQAPRVIEIDIANGTAAQIAAGVKTPLIPATVGYTPGSSLLIRNSDSVVHQIGSIGIEAGEQKTVAMEVLAVLNGASNTLLCSFHSSGSISFAASQRASHGHPSCQRLSWVYRLPRSPLLS